MYKDILVPVDTSDEMAWRKPLEAAVALAQLCGAQLHVMAVVPSLKSSLVGSFFPADFEQKMHEKASTELHEFVAQHVPPELTVQTVIAVGTIYEEIIHYADQLKCDLIIMGRSSSHRTSFLLGPNASRVMRHAKTSVLVAH